MTRKRKSKRKMLVAPGRVPDEADHVIAAVRANHTYAAPTKTCRQCGKPKTAQAYAANEWRKLRPMCLACASAPMRKATQPLPKVEPQKRPLSPHAKFRMSVADDDAFEIWSRHQKWSKDE